MNVINVDSHYDLNPEIVEYVHAIARAYDQFADKGPYCPVSLTELMNRIPVLLVSKQSMPEDEGDIDPLGFYLHKGVILKQQKPLPMIGLCMDRIVQACRIDGSKAMVVGGVSHVEYDSEKLRILVAKVLIHEYAHAIMALPPGADDSRSVAVKLEYYTWMEEAMANLFTLECFAIAQRNQTSYRHYKPWGNPKHIEMTRVSNKDPLEFAEEFIRDHQCEGYLLGLLYFKLGIGKSWLWSTKKRAALLERKDVWSTWHNNSDAQLKKVQRGQALQLADIDAEVLVRDYAAVLGIADNEVRSSTVIKMLEQRLHKAAARGDVQECRVILEAGLGVDIECRDVNGWTPLHHAAYNGHAELCEMLLAGVSNQRANVNAEAWG
jgi:hypothetical protein